MKFGNLIRDCAQRKVHSNLISNKFYQERGLKSRKSLIYFVLTLFSRAYYYS